MDSNNNIGTGVIEAHPLEPFLPEGATLLMLGAFPPPGKRWAMPFYYPNFINDMWRIFGLVYFGDKEALTDTGRRTFRLDAIRELLIEKGIALSDTAQQAVRTRGNAADKYLKVEKQVDLEALLGALPELTEVVTTGKLASGVVADLTGTEIPAMGEYAECSLVDSAGHKRHFRHWRMPSSSRAYPMSLAEKAACYARVLPGARMDNQRISAVSL